MKTLAIIASLIIAIPLLTAAAPRDPNDDEQFLQSLVDKGGVRVTEREVRFPGPDGRLDSYDPSNRLKTAATSQSGDKGSETDDIGIVVQASWSDCPDGWACLYDYTGWRGRMLKFQSVGYWQDLANWGFRNKTSSWRNRRNHSTYLDRRGCGDYQYRMHRRSASRSLNSTNNNAFDCIRNTYIN